MIPAIIACLLAFQDPGVDAADSIWKRLSFYSDGRMRAESTFDQPNGHDRHRGRMRLRVGSLYDVTENVRAEARLSTAAPNDDANNPHWDFGDGAGGFSGSEVKLDRFNVAWATDEDVTLRVGKFAHAFASPPIMGEFVWDNDVNPAGVAAVWDPKASESGTDFDLRAVEYVAVESSSDSEPTMFGVQGNVSLKTSAKTRVELSASYSDWSSLGAAASDLAADNQGNTDVTGDFAILEAFVAGTYEGGPLERTTAFVQGMKNRDDEANEDTGVALGAQLGRSGKMGDRNLFAVWYDLDANCVFSPVAQDDTPITGTGIGTGMDGVILGGQYFVTDNLSIKLWALTSDADAADDPLRIRLDLDFKIK